MIMIVQIYIYNKKEICDYVVLIKLENVSRY